jgi:ATP-binding cassette subfamily B protein
MRGAGEEQGAEPRGSEETSSLWDVTWRTTLLWRPHVYLAIPLTVALVCQVGFRTFFSVQLKNIIDTGLVGGKKEALLAIGAQLCAGYVVATLAGVAASYLTAQAGARILNDLRRSMFARMQTYSMDFFKCTRPGDILARYTSDLSEIEKGLTTRFTDGNQATLGLLITIPALFLIQWQLTLIALVLVPLVSLGARFFTPRAFRAYLQLKRAQGALASTIHENVQAQPVIKVFSLGASRTEQFDKQLTALLRRSIDASFFSMLVGTTSALGVKLVHLLVVVLGTYWVSNGWLSIGGLVAYVALLSDVSSDAYTLSKKVFPSMIAASSGFKRIDELLQVEPQVVDAPGAFPLPRLSREIRFDHVSFRYSEDSETLRDVSFAMKAGQYVVFVGKTGSGKSTIVHLLARLYDPTAGRVLFDGVDLRDVTQASVRDQIAVVFQDTFLFHGSIRENIRQGKLDATNEEIEAAARAAEIHEAIVDLPEGYETFVGEAGGLLSGGQRQRIAIARAIIRNPAVLILDEPTSGLDLATESAIAETLARLSDRRTVIAVTHRPAPMKRANHILVVDAGQILEQGAPQALLDKQGAYHRLTTGHRPRAGRDLVARRRFRG